ncbi:hypothetical protein [Ruminococcus sp.]
MQNPRKIYITKDSVRFRSHSEARLDLSGGQFKLNFNLDGELA